MGIKTKQGFAPEALNLSGELFKEAMTMGDIVLNEGTRVICSKGIENGTFTLTLNIRFVEQFSEDSPHQMTYCPIVNYKVGFNYKEKFEQNGEINGADMQIQLTSENGEDFIVRPDPNGQLELDLE